MELFQADMFRP